MARLRLSLPQRPAFQCSIPVRITDLNYGGHVGNDTILTLMHEARMQYLRHLGYSEMEFGGTGLIMADSSIEYKNELFYGDIVEVTVYIGDTSKIGFELYYKLEKNKGGKSVPVAFAKTGMICYDYDLKKIAPLTPEAKDKLLPV